MIEAPPKNSTWVIWAVITGLMIETLRHATGTGWGYLVAFLALVAGVQTFIEVVYLIWWRAAARWRMMMETRARTERVQIYEVIGRMNEHQLRFLETASPTTIILAGSPGPMEYLLKVSGAEVPYAFVHMFMEQSQGLYLAPIGTWSEGSKQRRWAQLLTNHFIVQGFAERWNGNFSAKWIDRAGAIRWLGLDRDSLNQC